MNYSKHKIWRIKDLDRQETTDRQVTGIYEVVFERQTLNFLPGSRVKLLGLEEPLFFVASGIKEPWVRLIVDSASTPRAFWGRCIKIEKTLCMYPELLEDKDPAFYVSGEGIALPLAYISTFPDRRPEIVYLGPAISLEFLEKRSRLKRDRVLVDGGRLYYCRDGVKRYGQTIR